MKKEKSCGCIVFDDDKILLIKDGKIIEEGNHNELIHKQGEYYELVNA